MYSVTHLKSTEFPADAGSSHAYLTSLCKQRRRFFFCFFFSFTGWSLGITTCCLESNPAIAETFSSTLPYDEGKGGKALQMQWTYSVKDILPIDSVEKEGS